MNEALDKQIWKFIGNVTVCSMTKYTKTRLYYIKSGKTIRVEDFDNVLCYYRIRDTHLEQFGMTLEDFEQWLLVNGVKRQVQKRVKRQLPLYD